MPEKGSYKKYPESSIQEKWSLSILVTKVLIVSTIPRALKYPGAQESQERTAQKIPSYQSGKGGPQIEFCHIRSILLCTLLFHLINDFCIRGD